MKKEIKIFIKAIGLKPVDCDYIKKINMIRNCYYTGFVFDDKRFTEMTKIGVERKKIYSKECLAKKDYDGFVYIHTRPFRLEKFLNIYYDASTNMTKKALGKLITSLWIDCENPYRNTEIWKMLFKSHGRFGMNKEERKELKNMSNEITIYRGIDDVMKKDKGISWTLSEEKANWFANRFNPKNPKVLKKTIKKAKITCYLNDRNEKEVIII